MRIGKVLFILLLGATALVAIGAPGLRAAETGGRVKLTEADDQVSGITVEIPTGESKAEITEKKIPVELKAEFSHPMLPARQKQIAYVRVGVKGRVVPVRRERAPLNLALVIDKSGSMSGTKIARAREAAIAALEQLDSQDIVSVITYDSDVRTIVPATKLTDQSSLIHRIRQINAGGSTALFGGVSKGAEEVRKFLADDRVNRIILLSDGKANVGPSTPRELGSLGASLVEEGVSVTTIGLGLDYNEDLMVELADRSDGNHYFAEEAAELSAIFSDELGAAFSVVARDARIRIICDRGVRPVRVIGRDAAIDGREVEVVINQLYGGNEKEVLLEVEVSGDFGKKPDKEQVSASDPSEVAKVRVRCEDLKTKTTFRMEQGVEARITESKDLIEEKRNDKVMVDVVRNVAVERNEEAVKLRDRGQVEKAQDLLRSNAVYLGEKAEEYRRAPASKQLDAYGSQQLEDAHNIEKPAEYKRQRKVMREQQYQIKTQQVAPNNPAQ